MLAEAILGLGWFWQVVLLGLIEGVTEFLPISSTGHLLLAGEWLGRRGEAFTIIIQLGAIAAAALVFRKRLTALALHARENRDYVIKLITAVGVTVVGTLLARKAGWELPERVAPVAWATLIGALVIGMAEWRLRGTKESGRITWPIVIAVGLAQVVAAIFPGTSRSGATMITAMLFGLARPAATEFSFLVGIPTMAAASAYAFWKHREELLTLSHAAALQELAVGFIVASLSAFVVVRWLLRYVQTHTFWPFVWYRIALGLALLWWFGA